MAGDRERWNARWRDQAGELAPPAAFLVEHTSLLPRSGRALDVAGGAGRHSVWLARHGLDVTMVDVSDVALERAERRAVAANVAHRIRFRWVDLADPGPAGELPPGPFDVIVMFHYLDRARRDAIADLLTVGGIVLACQPTVRNLEQHARPSREYLVDEGELAAWAARLDLEVLVAREGWNAENRHEAELIARRREPPGVLPLDPGSTSSGPYR